MIPVNDWPKAVTCWIESRTLFVSIPFTWLLPAVKVEVRQRSLFWDHVVVGGPATVLQPGYFDDVPWAERRATYPGALQKVNPSATKTTTGCPNRCRFCIEGKQGQGFHELDDWPDLPVLIDSNLLAASQPHLDRVFDRLERWGWADFNQGLDARRLTQYHAERLARIGRPVIRLALDHAQQCDAWENAYTLLRTAGIAKAHVRSYALVGFDSGPDEAWNRCQWLESHGIKPLPMWFHELDATKPNTVTARQQQLGWTDYERRRIMQWFYQHKRAPIRSIPNPLLEHAGRDLVPAGCTNPRPLVHAEDHRTNGHSTNPRVIE